MVTTDKETLFLTVKDKNKEPLKFPLTVRMMKLILCWPLSDDISRISTTLYYLGFWYLISNFIFIVFGHYYYIYKNWGDIIKVTECLSTALTGQHALLRLTYFYYNRNSFRKLLINLGKHFYISHNENFAEAEKCRKEIQFADICSAIYLTAATTYSVVPFLASDTSSLLSNFPFSIDYPFDVWESPIFEIVFAVNIHWCYVATMCMFTFNSILIFIIIYICGQYKLLVKNIEDIKEIINISERKLKLGEYVQQHIQIINFIKDLELFFSPIVLINFVHSSLLICVLGFQIAVFGLKDLNSIKWIPYIIAVLSQLFILCFEGDKLKEYSWNVADAAYCCDWEKTEGNTKFIKNLGFIIIRAQKPTVITSMKFSELCLKSYTSILSSSLSYFALLQTLIENEIVSSNDFTL